LRQKQHDQEKQLTLGCTLERVQPADDSAEDANWKPNIEELSLLLGNVQVSRDQG